MSGKRLSALFVLLAASGWTGRVACAPEDVEANRHFNEALTLLDRGKVDAAIREFESAVRVRPNFAVLYDLGKAYGLASRPAEAVDTLRRYLDEGGSRVDEQRRREVEATITFYEGLLGVLVVKAPVGSTIEIDGKVAEPEAAVRVRAGRHSVLALRDHFVLANSSVDVSAGRTTEVRLEPVAPPPTKLGWLSVHCNVPGALVAVDGEEAAHAIAAEPVPLAPGTHHVLFTRDGYVSRSFEVTVQTSSVSSVGCGLKPRFELRRPRESAQNSAGGARTTKTLTLVSAAGGLTMAAIAGGLLALQSREMAEWRADRRALSTEMSDGPVTRDDLQRLGRLEQRAAGIQRTGDAAVGAAVLGGALLAVSVGLLVTVVGRGHHELALWDIGLSNLRF